MKKFVSIILLFLTCITFLACSKDNSPTTPITPPVTPPSTEQTPPKEEESGGTVITPIKPGGNFEVGGDYGN